MTFCKQNQQHLDDLGLEMYRHLKYTCLRKYRLFEKPSIQMIEDMTDKCQLVTKLLDQVVHKVILPGRRYHQMVVNATEESRIVYLRARRDRPELDGDEFYDVASASLQSPLQFRHFHDNDDVDIVKYLQDMVTVDVVALYRRRATIAVLDWHRKPAMRVIPIALLHNVVSFLPVSVNRSVRFRTPRIVLGELWFMHLRVLSRDWRDVCDTTLANLVPTMKRFAHIDTYYAKDGVMTVYAPASYHEIKIGSDSVWSSPKTKTLAEARQVASRIHNLLCHALTMTKDARQRTGTLRRCKLSK